MIEDTQKIILIVDDDPLFARMYERLLLKEGYVVHVARNGNEGLESMRSKRPDLVLLDLLMPQLNGLEMLKAAKRDPELAALPIIIFTSLSAEKDRKESLAAGAADYFIKESSATKPLLKRIKELLQL